MVWVVGLQVFTHYQGLTTGAGTGPDCLHSRMTSCGNVGLKWKASQGGVADLAQGLAVMIVGENKGKARGLLGC